MARIAVASPDAERQERIWFAAYVLATLGVIVAALTTVSSQLLKMCMTTDCVRSAGIFQIGFVVSGVFLLAAAWTLHRARADFRGPFLMGASGAVLLVLGYPIGLVAWWTYGWKFDAALATWIIGGALFLGAIAWRAFVPASVAA